MQNANDQALGWPMVRFELIELAGESLNRFLEAVCWQSLLPHLLAAAETRGGRSVKQALRDLEQRQRFMVLKVEDRNTIGLTGEETEGESHFRALCKDTLYSHKIAATAGGSYGLGKSVLWSFSAFSTVLFNSILSQDPEGRCSPRLIGRAELPSHGLPAKVGRVRWFTGSGWFGRATKLRDGAERAESIWEKEASERAKSLLLDRPDRSGTTILILGFRDPADEADDSVASLTPRIREAALKYFWPSMLMDTRRLKLFLVCDGKENSLSIDPADHLFAFTECYRNRRRPSDSFEKPGDIAVKTIPIELPAAIGQQRSISGEVDLVVRLAEHGPADPYLGRVALFRGPGMVVRYWDRSGLTAAMQPFHAILICGQARNPRLPSESDLAIERFLRAAEPPGHDDWISTPALKQEFRRGYAKSIERLKDQVSEQLRKLLSTRPRVGTEGPDKLKKRFPIGIRGGSEKEPSPFFFSRLEARFDGERWRFQGEIRPASLNIPWHAELRLQELGEDDKPVESVPIESLDTNGAPVICQIKEGCAHITASRNASRLRFSGSSAAWGNTSGILGELEITVAGWLIEESAT
ncbi:MAG: hypothetical protein JXA30_15110 [Deltaproteobacteria bacterium]|nr:hypothetical protein [Deltaproteobacteria bacterium]